MSHVILCSTKIICKSQVDKTDQSTAPESIQNVYFQRPFSARCRMLGAEDPQGRKRNLAWGFAGGGGGATGLSPLAPDADFLGL